MEKDFIQNNLLEFDQLEQAYQSAPDEFKAQLDDALNNNPHSEALKVWQARLSYQAPEKKRNVSLIQLLLLCMAVGLLVKMHALSFIVDDWYIARYVPAIVISGLIIYFVLAADAIHRAVKVASFMGENWRSTDQRLAFVGYLGEVLIYTLLILLGGMVLTGITIALFSSIGLYIEQWYTEYVVVLGLASAPIVGTYLYDSIRDRESTFAPLLSNVFAPLFLITVIGYLVATVASGKSPFTDRNFLITLNGLLLVTLAITVFSISGKKNAGLTRITDFVNIALLIATLVLNAAALSAILYRWADEGTTVNRVVVTGANIIIFFHLLVLLWAYIVQARSGGSLENLKHAVARYLPVYSAWSFIVLTILPLVFKYQ